jgi:cytochrome c
MKQTFSGLFGAGVLALVLAVNPVTAKAAEGDAAKGKEVFEQCGVCHNADSDEKKMGPGLKGLFKKDKLKNGKKPTEENVKAIINAGGNGMPAYADMLADDERANLIAYLKTL